MGKQGRGKKPEKLGTGKVTPVQVAFIVDRYLAENQYTKTLAEFRSEAAGVLGLNRARQAPKSLLSLVDILDDYITLKEQRISLGQEKARIDQLVHAMQGLIFAYRSGGLLPGNTSAQFAAASSPMTISQSEATMPISGPSYPAAPASAAINPAIPTSVIPLETTNSMPVTGNKRKLSSSVVDASGNAKRPLHMTTPVNGSEAVAQGPQVLMNGIHGNSQADQASSYATHSQIYSGTCQTYWGPSYSLPTSTAQHDSSSSAKSSPNQACPISGQGRQQPFLPASQVQNDSTYPQTPPQAFPIQIDISASPLKAPSLSNGNTSLASSVGLHATSVQGVKRVSAKPVTDPETDAIEIRCSEKKADSSIALAEAPRAPCKDKSHGTLPSPSKPVLRKAGKRGHIKGRLDFNNSVTTSTKSPTKTNAGRAATDLQSDTVTNEEMDGELFDFGDIPTFNVADFEAEFPLDFLVDFELDSEGLPCAGAASVNQCNDKSLSDQSKKSADCEAQALGVLTEKDMNRQVSANLSPTDVPNCSTTKSCSYKGTKTKNMADQENVPTL